ncbi:PREDICTED: uncharacterized protein LOC104804770 isoform X1 [Tarenaya hassleriana]|uniref:uncharacterized protein LOC104804770 isoform X1 n=1 Tax=Tarenaya hassleriana TaxID=28532 RepID=UPI00053CA58D|nr:PREDICTED: uncharacterized protein LOC104804770 isoform X1 [Tarenaya hassleriana]
MGEINREEQRRYRRRDMSLAKDKIEAKCKRRNLLDLKESKFSFVYVLHQKCSTCYVAVVAEPTRSDMHKGFGREMYFHKRMGLCGFQRHELLWDHCLKVVSVPQNL